ncbi:MAG: hypothetical protein UU81_C0034G0009 [Microgenomates group bacterium GW2011_GWC1_41_8]|uniref:Probable pectate lyase C n=2 Tax=Patescibacteria group TaxID=1783273 RepID=A0A0G1M918_9BACT|nr:MAG: hypothetical protein UU41_C0033G0009 [Candidatus Roizmanbacteria bacterium GW2011_GWA1_41_13]KKS23276.1 MAG: hypothetical protein UU81_C0034G0009 [Microgenomates group bacterium GW2011_GWC1_41_8]KKU04577.1 MAG: hypothetical protein UX06_C0014G0005 [Candidatus Giovannonibacteria bacterium GW2011_GWA2_45_21]
MNIFHKIIVGGFIILFFFVSPQSSFAATRSVPSQYATIQSAHDAAATGDIIMVSPGTYAGVNISKNITIEATTYDSSNPENNSVHITSPIYMEASGNNWAWDQGIVIRGIHIKALDPVRSKRTPYTLEYSFIEATGQGNDGVSFEAGGGIVRGNIVDNGDYSGGTVAHSGDDNIDIDSQSLDILVENNILKNANQEGIEIRHQDYAGAARLTLTFRNNRVENPGQDGIQFIDYDNFTNRRYIVERNLFIGAGSKLSGAGIGVMKGQDTTENFSANPMPEALYVVNNTFLNGEAGISGGANVIAINNIFSGNTLFDLKNVNGNSKVMNSLFATTPKLQGTNNLESSSTITGNPLLDANFIPQTGSPAINVGRTSYQHTYTYNSQTFNDTVLNLSSSQYTGSAPDLGWKESGSIVVPTPTPTSGITPTPTRTPTPVPPTATKTPIPTPTGTFTPGDVNGDNLVTVVDLSILLTHFGKSPATRQEGNIGGNDNVVNFIDLSSLLSNFGQGVPTPTISPTRTPTPTATRTPTPTTPGSTNTPTPTIPVGSKIQTEPNLKVAFIGDSNAGSNFQAVLNLIKAEGAKIVMHQGDFDYSAGPQKWMGMIDTTLGNTFPYLGSDGNHDEWIPDGYRDWFSNKVTTINPEQKDVAGIDVGNYSVSLKGLKMVFVKEPGNDPTFINSSLSGDNHIWKICSWHQTMSTLTAGNHGDSAQAYEPYEECRRNGAIIINAHNHNYSRTKTMLGFGTGKNASPQVDLTQHPKDVNGVPQNPNNLLVSSGKTFVAVVGTGGGGLYAQTWCTATYPYGPAASTNAGCNNYVFAKVFTPTQVNLSPENDNGHGVLFITFNVNGNPRRAEGYFKDINGQIIDQFTITAP